MREDGTLTTEELGELAELRSKVYGFLSSAYVQVPSHDFVRRLLGEEVSLLLSTLPVNTGLSQEMEEGLGNIKSFVEVSREQAAEEVCQHLSVECTRLLRGIKPGYSLPPPYESIYREGGQTTMGRLAVEVHGEYVRAGVDLPAEYEELPDYIGLELDFMRYLTEKEAKAWRKDNRDKALGYLKTERDFLEEHITKWVPEFCGKVVEAAELNFYRGIARMTRGFVTGDRERVEALNDMVSQR